VGIAVFGLFQMVFHKFNLKYGVVVGLVQVVHAVMGL
jgi:hypothetical protein